MVLAICDRFKCLPDEAEAADASIIRRLELEKLAYQGLEVDGGGDDW